MRYYFEGKAADGAFLNNWPWNLHEDERKVTVASTLNRYLIKNGIDTDTVLDARSLWNICTRSRPRLSRGLFK